MLTHSLGRLSRKEAMMSEQKEPVQADGKGTRKDAPDGVDQEEVSGRTGGGESGGGPYPNPHTGKDGDSNYGGNQDHGGQPDNDYYGPAEKPGRRKNRKAKKRGAKENNTKT